MVQHFKIVTWHDKDINNNNNNNNDFLCANIPEEQAQWRGNSVKESMVLWTFTEKFHVKKVLVYLNFVYRLLAFA